MYDCTIGVRIVDVNGKAKIDRVVVEDENLSSNPTRVLCATCCDYDHGVEHPAVQAAETDEWPAWDFGW